MRAQFCCWQPAVPVTMIVFAGSTWRRIAAERSNAETAIEDNAAADCGRPGIRHVSCGSSALHRADANDDRRQPRCAVRCTDQARIFAADPTRVAARRGDFAVQGRS